MCEYDGRNEYKTYSKSKLKWIKNQLYLGKKECSNMCNNLLVVPFIVIENTEKQFCKIRC